MLKNYIKTSFRSLNKNRVYLFLNVTGLTIGLAAFLFIILYLRYETSFDRFHSKADNIYRLTVHFKSENGHDNHFARISADWTKTIPDEIPEVDQLIRFQNNEPKYVRIGQEKFRPDFAFSTDAAVFDVFNLSLLKGNPETALKAPYSVVITQSIARQYFGHDDVIGQELTITQYWTTDEDNYKITGILEDLPSNTHLPINMLTSFRNDSERSWWAYTYLLVKDHADPDKIKTDIQNLLSKNEGPEKLSGTQYVLQPLQNIHLHSDLAREIKPNGNILFVRIFSGGAIFILLIVMINFTNLSSVIAIGRTKEIGMRSLLGASKNQLAAYALFESVVLSLVASAIACVGVYLLFPFVKNEIAIENLLPFPVAFAGLSALAFIIGILSAFYPAFILTSLNPLNSTKNSKSLAPVAGQPYFVFKRALVTGQFALCILLIGSAIIAGEQFKYLNNKNLGLHKEQVIAIPSIPDDVRSKFSLFKNELEKHPEISRVSACLEVPSREIRDGGIVEYEGMTTPKEAAPYMDIQAIEPDFTDLMQLEILAGSPLPGNKENDAIPELTGEETIQRYFSEKPRSYLINETAMRNMGWNHPQKAIGRTIKWSQPGGYALQNGPISGVVKDFHQETLRNTIDPIIMVHEPLWFRTFLIGLSTSQVDEGIATINQTWNRLFPQYPFEYSFVDELYEKLYKREQRQLQLLYALCGLAIIIAFLGLFGLIAYSLKTRTREIAVRKIFGADFVRIMGMLNKEYLFVVLLASVISIPINYYYLSGWLESYAYRITISWVHYLITIAFILLILLGTISYHAFKGISLNPVDSLRET